MATNKEIVQTDTHLEASHRLQSIAAVKLYRSQIEVAKYLELAYLGLTDFPDVANEVRFTAQTARTQHLMTKGLMKSFMVTAKNIVGTMMPLMFTAVQLHDKDMVRDCFAKVITRAENMKKEAEDTRQQYFVIQIEVQKILAQMNTKNKSVSTKSERLRSEILDTQNLAVEHERATKELEEERDKKENIIKSLEASREKNKKATETAREAPSDVMTFFDACIAPTLAYAGPIGHAFIETSNIISSSLGMDKKKKSLEIMKEAHNMSQQCLDNLSADKQEVFFKIQEQKEAKLDNLSKIKKLCLDKALLGDANRLCEASSRLGEVDAQFVLLIEFWDNMVVTLKLLSDDTEAGDVFLKKLEDPRYTALFNESIIRAKNGWNSFGKICGDYVFACENDEKVAIQVLYKFLSAAIDEVPALGREMRMLALADEIQQEVDF